MNADLNPLTTCCVIVDDACEPMEIRFHGRLWLNICHSQAAWQTVGVHKT